MLKEKFLYIFIAVFISVISQAQEIQPEYIFNFEEATERAQAEEKPILLVFAGSDWCRPCIMFKKNILETPEFVRFSQQELIVLYLDFPAKKKNQLSSTQKAQNEALADRYNPKGSFPKILLINAEEQILETLVYTSQNAKEFVQLLQSKL